MKKKLSQSKRGRKKFSVGQSLSPGKGLDENLAIAATGEYSTTNELRKILHLTALWKNRYAPLFKNNIAEGVGTASIRRTHRERAIRWLLEILSPALENLDAKPFENFVKAIGLVKDLKVNGPLLGNAHAMLLAAEEMELKLGDKMVQTVSRKDYKKQLGRKIGNRQFARIQKRIGLHFRTGRPPKG